MTREPHVFSAADLYYSEMRRRLMAEDRRETMKQLAAWGVAALIVNLILVLAVLNFDPQELPVTPLTSRPEISDFRSETAQAKPWAKDCPRREDFGQFQNQPNNRLISNVNLVTGN